MSSVEVLSALLRDFGVDVTDHARRANKAKTILQLGVHEDVVHTVFKQIDESTPEKMVAGMIASLALDPRRLQVACDDVKAAMAARKQRRMDQDEAPKPAIDPRTHFAPIKSREDRCHYAHCRVYGDRKDHQTVADELGIDVADIPAMLAKGREMLVPFQPAKLDRSWDDISKSSDERRKEFRRRMGCGPA